MLNRWWSVSETCGELDTSLSFGVEDVEQCCATSRHIIIGATSPQAAPLWACQRLCMVCHLRWHILAAVAEGIAIRPNNLASHLPHPPTACTTARAVAISITNVDGKRSEVGYVGISG